MKIRVYDSGGVEEFRQVDRLIFVNPDTYNEPHEVDALRDAKRVLAVGVTRATAVLIDR